MPDDPAPLPPPPGTTVTRFWESGAAKGAIVVTVGLGLMFLRGWILQQPVSPEAMAVAAESTVWAWLAALGISRVDTNALRWK